MGADLAVAFAGWQDTNRNQHKLILIEQVPKLQVSIYYHHSKQFSIVYYDYFIVWYLYILNAITPVPCMMTNLSSKETQDSNELQFQTHTHTIHLNYSLKAILYNT